MISFTGPTLATERLTLRVPQAGDFPAFAALQASERAAALTKRLGAQRDGTWTTPTGTKVDVWRHRRAA